MTCGKWWAFWQPHCWGHLNVVSVKHTGEVAYTPYYAFAVYEKTYSRTCKRCGTTRVFKGKGEFEPQGEKREKLCL